LVDQIRQFAANFPGGPVIAEFVTSGKFWAGLLPSAVILVVVLWRLRRNTSHSVTVAIPFGLGSWSYDTTPVDRIVAWRMHIQLVSRKAALPFDPQFDLVCDVYDSLFALFGETRNLLLDLPPREFERASGVATLILKVQNDGIRPHLTCWQAGFRRWWERAEKLADNVARTPQEIQRDYPQYEALVADLQRTNTELQKYADELLRIAKPPKRPSLREKLLKIVPWPAPPDMIATAPTLESTDNCAPVPDTSSVAAPPPHLVAPPGPEWEG
jgi:hypothetical protein